MYGLCLMIFPPPRVKPFQQPASLDLREKVTYLLCLFSFVVGSLVMHSGLHTFQIIGCCRKNKDGVHGRRKHPLLNLQCVL